jgi:hypothetical protein
MTLSRGWQSHRFQVTRTIGSRFQQMYIGVLVSGPPAAGPPHRGRDRGQAAVRLLARAQDLASLHLPGGRRSASGVHRQRRADARRRHVRPSRLRRLGAHVHLVPQHVSLHEAAGESLAPRVPGAGHRAVQRGGRSPLGAPRPPRLTPPELVTVGISCESCHFGGREHALHERKIHFYPTSDAIRFERATPERVKDAPGERLHRQLHLPAVPYRAQHAIPEWRLHRQLGGGEGSDAGACASQIRCLDCHNPHLPGPTVGAAPDREEAHRGLPGLPRQVPSGRARPRPTADTPARAASPCLDCHYAEDRQRPRRRRPHAPDLFTHGPADVRRRRPQCLQPLSPGSLRDLDGCRPRPPVGGQAAARRELEARVRRQPGGTDRARLAAAPLPDRASGGGGCLRRGRWRRRRCPSSSPC